MNILKGVNMSNKHKEKIENYKKQFDSLISQIFDETKSIKEVQSIYRELDTTLSIAYGMIMEKAGYTWDESYGDWTTEFE